MADAAPAAPDDLEATYRQLLQTTLQPPPVPTPQGPTPSSQEGRGWLSLLGEALGGGQEYGSTAEREQGGIAALGAMGQRMLQASDYSYNRHSLGSIIGQGMGAATEALGQRQAVSASQAAAAQEYQQKQQELQLARVKEAVPILTQLQQLQQLKNARQIALGGGGTPGTTPGTSLAELTGDKAHDLPLIAQRESGGDPTALNYVAKADPTAYDRGATASGKYQIVNSTWRDGMQLAGIDPSKYATAREAPESVQDQVASALFDKYGNKPWQKGAKDWVKDESGRYQLATVRPPAGVPGGPTASPPASTVAADGKPVGDPTKPQLVPPPPGGPAGGPAVVPGVGLGAAVAALSAGKPQYTVAPPPQIRAQPIPAGRTTAENVQADVEAMQAGRQIAQTTPAAPGVLAAGPAAPTGGFTAGAGSYGTTAAPAPVAAPQAPPQGPPAAVVPPAAQAPSAPPALPPGGMPEPPPYAYQRQPLPPDIQSRIAQPLTPEQLEPYNRAIQSAASLEAIQAAQDKRSAAIAAARAEVVKEGDAWQQNERNKGQDIWQKRWDAWNTNEQQRQQAAQKLENDLRIKAAEGEQTRITNKEAVFNSANQKGLETAQTDQAAARGVVAQLEGFRNISESVGQPGWLQTTKWPGSDHTIAEQLQQAGIPIGDTGGAQLLKGGMINIVKALREGMPMGSLSDRDLAFIERMGPTEWMDPDTRAAAIGYLLQANRAKMAFARDVQKEMSRGKNYGDAVDTVDAKSKPFVPQVPADLTDHWKDDSEYWKQRRMDWGQKNDAGPGTLIHMDDGRIVVLKRPPRKDKGQG